MKAENNRDLFLGTVYIVFEGAEETLGSLIQDMRSPDREADHGPVHLVSVKVELWYRRFQGWA
jgi:hypothetical protein